MQYLHTMYIYSYVLYRLVPITLWVLKYLALHRIVTEPQTKATLYYALTLYNYTVANYAYVLFIGTQ